MGNSFEEWVGPVIKRARLAYGSGKKKIKRMPTFTYSLKNGALSCKCTGPDRFHDPINQKGPVVDLQVTPDLKVIHARCGTVVHEYHPEEKKDIIALRKRAG